MRSPAPLVVLFVACSIACSDRGTGVPVLDDTGRDALVDGAVDDTTSCPSNQTSCNGRCLDLSSDPLNCGGCGAMCPSSSLCNGGLCVAPTPGLQ